MAAKNLNHKFIEYLYKNKIISKDNIKKGKDLESLVTKGIIESLKKENEHPLSNFGVFRKTSAYVSGRNVKNVEFIPNEALQKSITGRYVSKKEGQFSIKKNLKMIFIILGILSALFILFGILFTFCRNDIKSFIDNQKSKNEMRKQHNNDLSGDADTTNDIVTKENIDMEDENVYATKEEDLVIKIRGDKDPELKEGEYKEELIEYNGKIYKKFKYTIKKGDTLWDISAKFLDDAFRWPFLHNINKYIIDPDVIEPGDPLTIYVENKS
ncbi:MAG TPA: LysM peptidoglycan-binding domain-containing protein [Spirochaetota bacterium]|jgi:nucleoid-associated protein YgaU|nr:MAG: LysM domain/BON superfamily protein [Spirochaetes bacterium ADurb.Bin133]HNZ28064.1 LysM peptidoglycan-binding domain-containing protein [Spirochaetota bacterium]HPY87639.1 LysM peptidoglycan-binding domain-containing protein [Spirochaetota bacterium]HQB61605.1 LysM peptidoglycan-binding domain-containing protein [Spirochaetota bacterium]